MEAIACKVRITRDMVGKPCFILVDADNYNVSEWGEYIAVKFIPGKDQRSLQQHNLYWKILEVWCEHKGDDPEYGTKEKCHVQVRWAVKFIDKESAVHVVDKNGNSRLYFELKSTSFDKRKQREANEFFADAFRYIADDMGLTVDELVAEAQSMMKARRVCHLCGGVATDKHHLYSQTKQARELYGKLLDDPRNIVYLCNACHIGGASIPKLTEREFCAALGIEIRSKSGQGVA
jgi:hypothetical protein